MAWHSIPYISNKKHSLNVIRLVATFLFFLGLVAFVVSFANLFHQWDTMSNINTCFEKSYTQADAQSCRDYFYQTTGVALYPDRYVADQTISIMVSFWPIVSLFFWIIIMLLGIFLYNIGNNWHTLIEQRYGFSRKEDMPEYLGTIKKTKK